MGVVSPEASLWCRSPAGVTSACPTRRGITDGLHLGEELIELGVGARNDLTERSQNSSEHGISFNIGNGFVNVGSNSISISIKIDGID